ncbi:Alpha-amylase/alpha-mannosidase [Syntrophobacter sp. SbD1]|nr:Alpha-amylase/alpha-mannosidase [Syntrophobacter sp. SbD1]
MDRFVCIHGHFYQPPRESPWLEAIEIQDSAFPYHDWNERITAECYAANAVSRIWDTEGRIAQLVNNYASISFNFGPTVLLWMQRYAAEAYEAILEADRRSLEKFSGHGNALAQAYNHMILPLANSRDKNTQILWGIKDFEYRFGRKPEGLWLPETAVDLESLDIMAQHGIVFAILAPSQASRVRPFDGNEWQDVSGGRVDPGMAYQVSLPSGRVISLFFYDGPISQALAFEGLLNNGETFANRLLSAFPDDHSVPRLVHIATDGESYGHHHRGGDMALAHALRYIESNELAQLTNYGWYLEDHPPTHEVEIFENSSWSCVHGIERWRSDCGCNSGGNRGWNQSWRAPLRAALDWLRDAVNPAFEQLAGQFLTDPWAARDDYIDVIVDRLPDRISAFLNRHAVRTLNSGDEITVLKLMELQRNAMLMYTSCGWFFDELSGIETVQVIEYAGRVLQLADELFNEAFEPGFLELLERAKSNIPEHSDGRTVYDKWVRPAMLDMKDVGAHYALSSLFQDIGERSSIYAYSATREDYRSFQVGGSRLVIGRATVTSEVTRVSSSLCFGVLHLGDHSIACGTGEYQGAQKYETLAKEISAAFAGADFPKTILLLGKYFGTSTYSLSSLFADERRKVLDIIMGPTLREAQAAYSSIYEHHAPLIRFLTGSGTPRPRVLSVAADFCLNAKLRRVLQEEGLDPEVIRPLLEEARLAGATLDATALGLLLAANIESLAEQLLDNPGDLSCVERLNKAAQLVRTLPFEVNLWKTQNICYKILQAHCPNSEEKAGPSVQNAKEWRRHYTVLAENFLLRMPVCPANNKPANG